MSELSKDLESPEDRNRRGVAIAVQVEVFEPNLGRPFELIGKDVLENWTREARTISLSVDSLADDVAAQLGELVELVRRQLAARFHDVTATPAEQ